MEGFWTVIFAISLALLCACTPKPQTANEATQAELVSTLGELETTLRQKPDQVLDSANVLTFVRNAQALASRFPQDSLAPVYLFRAAELCHATGKFNEAIGLWGQIGTSFSPYIRSAEAVFMQGFVAENELKDRDKALEYYEVFLEKYPEHPMAKDAQVLLANLKRGVTDQQLIEQFEQQQQ